MFGTITMTSCHPGLKIINGCKGSKLFSYCHNPTQKQLNLTWLRLDIIINPNPPHPHKLSKAAEATVVTAWRQHDISLMWGWHQTVWGTSHRRVQTGTWEYAWVRACTRVWACIQTAQLTICLKQLWFGTVHIEGIALHEWKTYQGKVYS